MRPSDFMWGGIGTFIFMSIFSYGVIWLNIQDRHNPVSYEYVAILQKQVQNLEAKLAAVDSKADAKFSTVMPACLKGGKTNDRKTHHP